MPCALGVPVCAGMVMMGGGWGWNFKLKDERKVAENRESFHSDPGAGLSTCAMGGLCMRADFASVALHPFSG